MKVIDNKLQFDSYDSLEKQCSKDYESVALELLIPTSLMSKIMHNHLIKLFS